MRSMATRNGEMSNGTLFAAVLFLATLALMASAWDEEDFARIREEARAAKEGLARLAVEHSGYTHFYNSAQHCRVPGEGERLEMTLAAPHDPGKGYRCTYWKRSMPGYYMRMTMSWSRSPGLELKEGRR
ncbi:MAG: hypothetical protein K8F93_14615 [Burkholderiales bacterium]|nr:hypothetical protein [Burkholderiales bacterium]